ncbi:MAG: hypothetical protein JWL88_796 [Parcubacteria group bacterium]|nr:hypothetical protein [Parcubacteria group bacterium]
MDTRSTHFRSLVDLVSEDPENISSLSNLETAKAIIRHIAPPVAKLDWLLVRIMESMYPSELLALLPEIYGREYAQLRLLVEALGEKNMGLPEDALETIADAYWSVVVRERIVRRDYRRAWDEIRRSFHGFRYEAFEAYEMMRTPVRYQNHMGASLECIESLIRELYIAMLAENLVPEDPWYEKVIVKLNDSFSKPSGIIFAMGINAYHKRDHIFTPTGMRVLRISEYAGNLRKKKRVQQTERKMSELCTQDESDE